MASLRNTLTLFDLYGAILDSGEQLGRVARNHDVDYGQPIRFPHALLQSKSERFRVFDAKATATQRTAEPKWTLDRHCESARIRAAITET